MPPWAAIAKFQEKDPGLAKVFATARAAADLAWRDGVTIVTMAKGLEQGG